MAKRDSHFPIDVKALPASWVHAPIGELVATIRPGFASGKHTTERVGIPHLRPMNISREGRLDLSVLLHVPEGKDLRVRPGDVLFNNTNSRELVGKTAPIVDGEYGFSNHMTRLRVPPSLDHRFVAYQLHYFWMSGYFRHLATQHVNQASISSGTLGQRVALVIPPHAEQIKIVSRIDEEIERLDATVAALHRVQTNAAEYRTLLVDLACRGRMFSPLKGVKGSELEEAGDELLRRITRERRPQPAQASLFESEEAESLDGSPKAQPGLPRGWSTASLAELSSDRSYGTSVKSDYDAPGPPVLRIPNVIGGRIDLSDLKRARKSDGLTDDKQLQPGDFLIVRTNGSKSLIGRAAVVTEPFPRPHFFASYLIRFRLLGSPVLWDWISLAWGSTASRIAIESVAWTTAGQYNVNLRTLGAIRLPLPPEREQERIVREVHAQWRVLDGLSSLIEQNLKRASELRFTIMERAFKGQLVRVPRRKAQVDLLPLIREQVGSLRDEEARLQREDNVARRKARADAPAAERPKGDIVEALRRSKTRVETRTLFESLGYDFEERDHVDAFYEQLSAAVRTRHVELVAGRKDTTYIRALT